MSNLKKKFTVDEEKVHEDYCVAHTEGNHNGYDDMRLCIEASNEENFHRI